MIELDGGIIAKCETHKAVLAYIAVLMGGPGTWTTAQLAGIVACQTEAMREGLQELSLRYPAALGRKSPKSPEWIIGDGIKVTEEVQILESGSERRLALIDDLKRYWDFRNPGLPFAFGAPEGKAVAGWLKKNPEWTQEMWLKALRNRAKSEVVHSQRIYLWLSRLNDFYDSPLDRYGKPMLNGGGKVGEAITTEQRNREARAAAVASVPAGR